MTSDKACPLCTVNNNYEPDKIKYVPCALHKKTWDDDVKLARNMGITDIPNFVRYRYFLRNSQ